MEGAGHVPHSPAGPLSIKYCNGSLGQNERDLLYFKLHLICLKLLGDRQTNKQTDQHTDRQTATQTD